jgi:hypothetical protein
MDGNEDSDFQWTIIDSVHTHTWLCAHQAALPFCFCLCCRCFFLRKRPFRQPASRRRPASLGVSFVYFIVIEGFPVRQSILTVAFVYSLVNTPTKKKRQPLSVGYVCPEPVWVTIDESNSSVLPPRCCSHQRTNRHLGSKSPAVCRSRCDTPAEMGSRLQRQRAAARSPASRVPATRSHLIRSRSTS